jgi:hypothetical protein
VIFEEFSRDWARKAKKAKNPWGWEGWYLFHRDSVEGKPLDLLMLRNGELVGYPG